MNKAELVEALAQHYDGSKTEASRALNAVVQTIEAFKAFTPAFIISEGTGGPIDSTLFYTLYLYQ